MYTISYVTEELHLYMFAISNNIPSIDKKPKASSLIGHVRCIYLCKHFYSWRSSYVNISHILAYYDGLRKALKTVANNYFVVN